MPYTPTDWVDGVTPVNEANLDKIEQALAKTPYGPDFATGRVPVYNAATGLWSNQFIFNGQIDPAAAIAISKLAGYPADATKYLRGDGTWAVVAAGGGGTDWEGAWSAGFPYVKGDVVTYNGVTYVAVNDSTGQTPPAASQFPVTNVPVSLVTTLPSSPFDGQVVDYTDSLTAPTFTWRLRYVAAKATNKWVFVGGSPLEGYDADSGTVNSATYTDLSDQANSPQITIPVAGLYLVETEAYGECQALAVGYMSYAIGATPASDTDFIAITGNSVNEGASISRGQRKTLTAGTLTVKYKTAAGGVVFQFRRIAATPIAVGG